MCIGIRVYVLVYSVVCMVVVYACSVMRMV